MSKVCIAGSTDKTVLGQWKKKTSTTTTRTGFKWNNLLSLFILVSFSLASFALGAVEKNTQTMDLSAFMLHGKVKTLTEFHGDNGCISYRFNEQGKLISFDGQPCRSSSSNSKCTIRCQKDKFIYTFDGKGRIIYREDTYEEGGGNTKFSKHNEYGWPTQEVDLSAPWIITQRNYSDLDYYGNWTRCECVSIDKNEDTEEYSETIYRVIEYYPGRK